MFTGYKGAAKRLDDIDLPKIGAEIGVGEDELHAFMDVECGGSGFDAKGRVKMLFEPHVFYRELGPGKKRDQAVKQGVAYAKWKPGAYPTDSYPRLLTAMKIDETAALRSASWGLGQIMGLNCAAVGYGTPQLMVKAFAADEENQLRAIVSFLKTKGLVPALQAHDWAKIEKVYNGGGYKGAYAVRMHNAFARWQAIKNTPWHPEKQEAPAEALQAVLAPAAPPPAPAAPEPAVAPPAPARDSLPQAPSLDLPASVQSSALHWIAGTGAMAIITLAAWLAHH